MLKPIVALLASLMSLLFGAVPGLAWEQGRFRSGMLYDEAVRAWGIPRQDLVRAPVSNRPAVTVLNSRKPDSNMWLTFCHETLYEIQFGLEGGLHQFAEMVDRKSSKSGKPIISLHHAEFNTLITARWVDGVEYVELILHAQLPNEISIGKTFGDQFAGRPCD